MSIPGDREDFDEFAAGSWRRLIGAAFLLTGNVHDAEELAQTALTGTYVAWRRVRRDDAWRYARKALVNANIDRHRARMRRPQETFAAVLESADPQSATATIEDRDQLMRLLGLLATRERAVVVLRYYCDLSVPEVAQLLDVSQGTVKSSASRALAKLRVAEGSAVPSRHGIWKENT